VLLLGAVLPRRADTTAVIGTALQASARGIGYRRIAAQLGRPASTVRRWVRAVREDHHVEWLRDQGVGWIARVDRDVLATLAAESTRLGEALTALAAAAVTVRARLTPHVPPWTLIGQFSPTGGSSPQPTPADDHTPPESSRARARPPPCRRRHPRHRAPGRHRADQGATAPTETARDVGIPSASPMTPTSAH
jgi:transposase-like protein